MKHFPTHIISVFGIVENDAKEILLLLHNGSDGWMFPGGQVEVGENLIDALVRETKEESNMDIVVSRMYCVSSNTAVNKGYDGYESVPTKINFGFMCQYMGGVFQESDESVDSKWVPKDSVIEMLTVPMFIDRYKAYMDFNGDITYKEYHTQPEYEVLYERFI